MTATGGVRGAAPAAAERGTLVFPVELRRVRRATLARELSESVPAAMTLLGLGLAGLQAPAASAGDLALAAAEIASAAWMLFLLRGRVRGLLGRGRGGGVVAPLAALPPLEHQHGGIDWAGIAGAVMLGVEALHHWDQTGRVKRPVLLLAAFTLFLATGGRLLIARAASARFGDRRPRLALGAEGIVYRGSRRRRFEARWDEVARVEYDAAAVTFALRDGRTFVLRARDHVDGDALVLGVRAALPRVLPPALR